MDSSLDKIKAILKKEIGLDTSTIGESTINKITSQRMRKCDIDNLDAYYKHLINNSEELHLLLETSVIPETWFFRDEKPFKIILDNISNGLKNANTKKCKILCIPCSTGEEPYSIAMYLKKHKIPDSAFDIQATDISQQSIAIAKQACYGKNSFRGQQSKKYIDDFFTLSDSRYELNNSIKSLVEFHRLNILNKRDFIFKEKFDFILCRNLLIYFDITTKQLAYNNLYDLLSNEGLLFIGHSEFGSVPEDKFKTTKINSAFCLIKTSNNTYEVNTKSSSQRKQTQQVSKLKLVVPPAKKAFANTEQDTESDNKNHFILEDDSGIKLLDHARTLANIGNYDEAEANCLKYIDQNGDHEESFFLLGLISEACGNNNQAQDFYKKALYLNPKHYETLIHLSLILESQGEIEASQRLKERAKRAEKE